ncbi:MAG: prenyltransferase/squalene oxidase repeat-containing protein [Bacteroidota bacterium]
MRNAVGLWCLLIVFGIQACLVENNKWQNAATATRAKAIQYLLQQQQTDGSWRSITHGILKGGIPYTAYIADALQESRDTSWTQERLGRAYAFLRTNVNQQGAVGYEGSRVIEYPVYATSYAYRVAEHSGIPTNDSTLQKMRRFLLDQQFVQTRGIEPWHEAYGAWGFGELNLPKGEVGHVDLSHTRRVLETLRQSGLPEDHPVWKNATVFLDRIQNPDGGFCSSSHTLGANKADDQNHKCASYATATADGILALASLPDPPMKRLQAAAKWLYQNENWDAPSGITPERPGNWDKVLFYYHLAVRTQAYRVLEGLSLLPVKTSRNWRAAVNSALQDRQEADGSYSNPWGAPNKEDDPLLATALVIRALNAALEE